MKAILVDRRIHYDARERGGFTMGMVTLPAYHEKNVRWILRDLPIPPYYADNLRVHDAELFEWLRVLGKIASRLSMDAKYVYLIASRRRPEAYDRAVTLWRLDAKPDVIAKTLLGIE